jgi:EF hand
MEIRMKSFKYLVLIAGLALSSTAFAGPADKVVAAVDSNGDGKLSQDEHTAVSSKMFGFLDTDKNGVVTAAEMDAVQDRIAAKHGVQQRLNSADKIKGIDSNKDGAISLEEHTLASKSMFNKMDADKDGFVSAQERQAAYGKLLEKSKR